MSPRARAVCVVGPGGAGKSTFCGALAAACRARGETVHVVNMDPANECPPYACDADVAELVRSAEVQRELDLGPNAALLHAMTFIAENAEWAVRLLAAEPEALFVLDFPGQMEIYTATRAMPLLLSRLAQAADLLVVQMYDSFFFYDAQRFLAGALYALLTSALLEQPGLVLVSKIDLLAELGDLPFSLDQYLDGQALRAMTAEWAGAEPRTEFERRFADAMRRVGEVVTDYGAVIRPGSVLLLLGL